MLLNLFHQIPALEKEIHNVYNRDVEKKKYLAKHVVAEVQKAGFKKFAQILNTYECGKWKMQKIRPRDMQLNYMVFGIGMRIGLKELLNYVNKLAINIVKKYIIIK